MGWMRNFFARFTVVPAVRRFDPGAFPVRVTFSAPVQVRDVSSVGHTGANGTPPPEITDPARLRTIEQAECDEWFADYLGDDPELARLASVLSGGELTFALDAGSGALRLKVTFGATRRLSGEEVAQLREDVHGQLLDGIGENFQQHYAYGRTCAEHQAGKGSRMWLAFEKLDSAALECSQQG
jgi:hypothetical protein